MSVYFITRHAGALAWAKAKGVHFDVHLTHLGDIQDLQAGNVVIGSLPINIVYLLGVQGVKYVHLSLHIPEYLRGVELTHEQLDECQATLECYAVTRVDEME